MKIAIPWRAIVICLIPLLNIGKIFVASRASLPSPRTRSRRVATQSHIMIHCQVRDMPLRRKKKAFIYIRDSYNSILRQSTTSRVATYIRASRDAANANKKERTKKAAGEGER